jgi:anti-sigma-K factor RskA
LKTRLVEQARHARPIPEKRPVSRRWLLDLTLASIAATALVIMAVSLYSNRELRQLTSTLTSRIAQLEAQLQQQRSQFATLTSPQVRVVDMAGQGANVGAGGRIFWDQQQRRWLFYVRDLPPAAANQTYQLWFVPTAGNPISATVFNTALDGSAEVEIDVPANLDNLRAAAVTTEPAGGLPQPSGPFALLGALE